MWYAIMGWSNVAANQGILKGSRSERWKDYPGFKSVSKITVAYPHPGSTRSSSHDYVQSGKSFIRPS